MQPDQSDLLARESGPFRLEALAERFRERDEREEREAQEEEAGPLAQAIAANHGSPLFADLAVPPFSATLKRELAPLLSPRRVEAARTPNRDAMAKTGLDAEQVRAAIAASYVDEAALEAAVKAAGQPFDDDARLAHLVHQVEKKISAEGVGRGVVTGGLLDSLGFLGRPKHGLSTDRAPALSAARAVIAEAYKRAPALFERAMPGLTATNWFSLFMNPSFLGWSFGKPVHPLLVRQLRVAEVYLRRDPANRDLSPVELGRKLGVHEPHAGGRTAKGSTSMHTFGLALDIAYSRAPFILGERGPRIQGANGHERDALNARFSEITARATFLVEGMSRPLTADGLGRLGSVAGFGTRNAYEEIRRYDETLRTYFALEKQPTAARELAARRDASNVLAMFGTTSGEGLARKAGADREEASRYYRHGRDALKGFLPLALELVMALRDGACFAWGAIDFGAGSGDMMHFDLRATGVGRFIGGLLPERAIPGTGHPCVAATSGGTAGGALHPAPAHRVHRAPHSSHAHAHAHARAGASTSGSGGAVALGHADREITPDGTTLYLPQDLGFHGPPKLPTTAVFVPNGFAPDDGAVDVILYLHGKKDPCGGNETDTIREMLAHPTFRGLRAAVTSSFKNVVLVAPTLGFRGECGPNGGRFRDDQPWALLDGVMAPLGSELGKGALRRRKIILAGHSIAGPYMVALLARGAPPPELIALWGLDCTYSPVEVWKDLIASHPALEITLVRATGGGAAERARAIEKVVKHRRNAHFIDAGVKHCDVPVKAFPALLAREDRLALTRVAARLQGAR